MIRQASQGAGTSDLLNLSRQLIGEAGPARKALLGQITEALKTGGVGAQIPIIQRSIEAATAAGAQTQQTLRQNIARSGLANSPFAVNAQLGAQRDISSSIAGIGPGIAGQIISGAPAVISGQTQQGLGGLGDVASMDLQRKEFNIQMYGKFMEDLKSSLQSTGSYGQTA